MKDDVFMGYNDDQDFKAMHFKVEINDDEDVDQVVPTKHSLDDDIRCEDSTSLDVLYVN